MSFSVSERMTVKGTIANGENRCMAGKQEGRVGLEVQMLARIKETLKCKWSGVSFLRQVSPRKSLLYGPCAS